MNKQITEIVTDENQSYKFIDILVEPARRKNRIVPDRYDTWDSNGDAVVTTSREPFLDSARKLLKAGSSSDAILRMFRLKDRYPSLTAPIIVAAALRVIFTEKDGEYFADWRGDSFHHVKARKRLIDRGATPVANDENRSVLELSA